MIKIFLDRDKFWSKQQIIFDWCKKNFGEYENGWTYTTIFGSAVFYFTDKEKATLFKLTWT